jgi:hypothetical protein
MLFIPALPLLALIQGAIAGQGQIPIIDGVIGGVPNATAFAAPISPDPRPLTISATTPGKLRVTENSGVCGEFVFPLPYCDQ